LAAGRASERTVIRVIQRSGNLGQAHRRISQKLPGNLTAAFIQQVPEAGTTILEATVQGPLMDGEKIGDVSSSCVVRQHCGTHYAPNLLGKVIGVATLQQVDLPLQ
jgi:hypothetical protein